MSDSSELLVDIAEAIVVLDQFPVLTNFAMQVGSGDVIWLEGPNGAGKTTALRLCAGLIRPAEGRVTVLGHDVFSDRIGFRPLVGYLGHHNALYGELTARENIEFAVRSHHQPVNGVNEVCERLGLSKRVLDTHAHKLSAGQRRRTSLATLLVRAPRLWLLDEPHAGLDSQTRTVLDEVIRDAARDGAGIVIASHDSERASAVANKHIHLDAGASMPLTKEPQHVG